MQGLASSARQLQSPLANLRTPLGTVSTQLTALKKPLAELSQPMHGLPGDVRKLSESVSTLRAEMRQLHGQIGSLHHSIDNIAQNVSMAVILGAITIAVSLFMHRKVPSNTQPTMTTVETVEESPETGPSMRRQDRTAARKSPRKKVSVMKTKPIDSESSGAPVEATAAAGVDQPTPSVPPEPSPE
ncbi:MAG: hypothetical protein U0105_02870 [Candidatus Obscuribacterales bacterium]